MATMEKSNCRSSVEKWLKYVEQNRHKEIATFQEIIASSLGAWIYLNYERKGSERA